MLRKKIVSIVALATIGLAPPTGAFARGGGGGPGGGGFHGGLFGATIYFRARADAHPFTPLIEQASQARTTGAEMASTAISAQRQSGGLNATSRCRALRNIKKQKRVLVSEARA